MLFIGVIPSQVLRGPETVRFLSARRDWGGHPPPGAGACRREGAKLDQRKSKRSELKGGAINTSLCIASADTSRLRFPPGIGRERCQPGPESGRERGGGEQGAASSPPAQHVGPGPPHTPHTPAPHTAHPARCRAAHAAPACTRRDTQGHTQGHTHSASARGTGKSIPFPRGSSTHPLPLAGGSWQATRHRGVRGCPGAEGHGGRYPELWDARCRPVPAAAGGGRRGGAARCCRRQ